MKFIGTLNVREGKIISIVFATKGYLYNHPVINGDIKRAYDEGLMFLKKKYGEVVIDKLVNFPYGFE